MAEYSNIALKDEIVDDPEGLGYKNTDDTWTGGPNPPKGDLEIADLINAKNLVVDRADVSVEEVRAVVTLQAFKDLLTPETDWVMWNAPASGDWLLTVDMKLQLTGRTLAADGVAGTGQGRDGFWGGSVSEQDALGDAMLALIEVVGSRAEVLWGVGITISLGQVGRAFTEI